jgi:CHAT domain-containing protein
VIPRSIDRTRIPPGVVIVEYSLAADGAYAWVVSRNELRMLELSGATAIDRAARDVHRAYSGFVSVGLPDRLRASATLTRLIIDPLALDASAYHTVVFIPDGTLHYVPFGALVTTPAAQPPHYLVEKFDIAVAPAVHLLLATADSHAKAAGARMLLVADPVYEPTDPRFSDAKSTTSKHANASRMPVRGARDIGPPARLLGSGAEARAIAALLAASDVDQLVGFSATRDGVLRRDLASYRFIHFAVHGSIDGEYPQLSALVLSGFDAARKPIAADILASDFSSVRLRADAVVMSACDTALGKEVVGEGLVGLRYVMLARGARSVVASLWQVPDEPTAELMQAFYLAMLRDGASPTRAISLAMKQMSAGRFSDPAWWGAFSAAISRFEAE